MSNDGERLLAFHAKEVVRVEDIELDDGVLHNLINDSSFNEQRYWNFGERVKVEGGDLAVKSEFDETYGGPFESFL